MASTAEPPTAIPRPAALFWPLWVAAVLVPLLLLAGAAWWSRDIVQAETRGRMGRTVAMLHEDAVRAFEVREAMLAAIQLRTAGLSWPEIDGSADIAGFLHGLYERKPNSGAIGMVTPDGRMAHFSLLGFPLPANNFADRDYFRAQQGPQPGPFIGEPYVGRLTGRAAFSYSRPRLDAAGRPDGGVIWSNFRLDRFTDFYAAVVETSRDAIMLVRRDGALLVHYPLLTSPAVVRLAQDGGAMRAIAAAPPGGVGFATGISPTDGKDRLYVARPLGDYAAAIVYVLHPDGPRRVWLRQVYIMAVVAGSASVLLLGLTCLAHWRTRRATEALAREHAALAAAQLAAEARAEAEAALSRGQRLAMLGQIVAGVAHDFRNVTQAVQGGALLISQALDRDDTARARTLAAMIAEAAGRGVDLTQRMLRVVGRTTLGPDTEAMTAVLDPAAVLAAATGLLGRTIGAGYTVRLEQAAPLPASVSGDAAEFEAALLNLALNARDAMPEGGEVAIHAVTEEVAPKDVTSPDDRADPWAGLPPGRYARISVADSGIGMDAETLARVGQAFFTTKPSGQGTGLGLATARAFARGAGGALGIASPGPECGTTVTLWLPEATAQDTA